MPRPGRMVLGEVAASLPPNQLGYWGTERRPPEGFSCNFQRSLQSTAQRCNTRSLTRAHSKLIIKFLIHSLVFSVSSVNSKVDWNSLFDGHFEQFPLACVSHAETLFNNNNNNNNNKKKKKKKKKAIYTAQIRQGCKCTSSRQF